MMDSPVEGPDLSDELREYSKYWVPYESKDFSRRWSHVQESPSFVVRQSLNAFDWKYLIQVLNHADVSRIEHLVLQLPHLERMELPQEALDDRYLIIQENQLGDVLLARGFAGLKSLRILTSGLNGLYLSALGGESLARALRNGLFTNLHTLSIPRFSTRILKALIDRHPCALTSLSLSLEGGRRSSHISDLLAFLQTECCRSLQHLELSSIGQFSSDNFRMAARSLNLTSITSLRLNNSSLALVNLQDLVKGPRDWFRSLEHLALDGCDITSKQVSSLVDAVMDDTALSLKKLDLHANQLNHRTVDALVRLADSHLLPQLEELDLSDNALRTLEGSNILLSFIKHIQSGSLPSLRKLNWERQQVDDNCVRAIVEAYQSYDALTTELHISWDGVSDLSLRTKLKTYRDRNLRLVSLRKKLVVDVGDFTPLTSAKVFLCGYPEVGKTRLRRTLLRKSGITTKLKWETRPNIFQEPRTRGIEIIRIQEKNKESDNTTLVLWDLAGQQEYHVLHGTFLADLGFEGGKATTFVVVFKAPFESNAEAKLLYWLRFVASASLQHVNRHVVIVLNCFKGKPCTENDRTLWIGLIQDLAKRFKDLLDIHPNPFIIDVRVAASAKALKDHLFRQARRLLQDVDVPRICFQLLENLKMLSAGEGSNHLPILTWQALEEGGKLQIQGNDFSVDALKIAASYLHEIGEIIYFEDKEGSQPRFGKRSVVVPNPEWFCRKIVGELLLPKEMWQGRSSLQVSADGSISEIRFQAFFQNFLVQGTHSDDVISMLELVGLCYRKGEGKIIVPALIREDDYDFINWEGQGYHWVMGRSLAMTDQARNVIPMTLFRRLQAALAQHPNFGGRGDSEYRVGKSFVNFKVGELWVLVQFDEHDSDPIDDRIDILVKSMIRGDPLDVTSGQVECICELMQKLEDLCVSCCPGLRYDIKVIKPSNAEVSSISMSRRTLMSLREIKDLLRKGKKHTSWQVSGCQVELTTFLSDRELRDVLEMRTLAAERDYDACKQDALILGLLSEESLGQMEGRGQERCSNAGFLNMHSTSTRSESLHDGGLLTQIFHEIQDLKEIVRRESRLTRNLIEKRSSELLVEIRQKHVFLLKQIQAQLAFSIEEKEASVPRYMFLSRRQQGGSSLWISLKEAFGSSYQLHFLCEAHFDDGFLHEVNDQEGIELKKTKEWLLKVSPWLRRSLQVAILIGKTVGNVYLPGVFNLIPDVNLTNDGGTGLAKAVDSAATMLQEEEEGVNHVQDSHGNYGTAADPVNLRETMIAQEVVKDLISELGLAVFAKKIGLRKVLLRDGVLQLYVGSSKQAQPSVLWICGNCRRNYGDRAIDISPTR